ncbi:MAG: PAS/PAC sensor signal transduction histidine kinase [candidate division WWE3 bacterium GW2011_GWF2_42_42]|uniref:PAS/PAC sensor signal transduction histidine kinase n=1 Tax=candidate division WWE3 bacterium GW2011_GWF2_42_42 TaxID=1619142 RepID=A0A0G1ADY3_UNCKA|nr:MAG: PAS/PAC sensor signal transduction histidine kinase [candidate division WWE3 bacterium GW2011_GWF2_42_42]
MPTDTYSDEQNIAQQIYQRNRELLQERRRAEDLLFNVSEGVFAVDKEFKITIFNNRLNMMLGLPEGTALGKDVDDVIILETEKGVPVDIKQYCFLPPQKMPILRFFCQSYVFLY